MNKNINTHNFKRIVNEISYEHKETDELLISVKQLLQLKNIIENLEDEVKRFKKLYEVEKKENRRLVGKVLENDYTKIDMYL